jgi:hypothetical protein
VSSFDAPPDVRATGGFARFDLVSTDAALHLSIES